MRPFASLSILTACVLSLAGCGGSSDSVVGAPTGITDKKSGVDVAASVVELKLKGFTLHKAVITGSLPATGVTTKMAYVLDGDKLYLTVGHRRADGLGDALSVDYAIRQAGV